MSVIPPADLLSRCRCSNQTAIWQPLIPEPEVLSVRTNVSFSETRKTSQVRSQVTFHKPQQVTVRCETSNKEGLVDRRDVKLVSSSKCHVKTVPFFVTAVSLEGHEFRKGSEHCETLFVCEFSLFTV